MQGRHLWPAVVAWAERQKQSLLVSQLRLDAVAGKVSVTEAEVRDYYEQHLEAYRSLPGVIEMTEVLVDTRTEAEELSRGCTVGSG